MLDDQETTDSEEVEQEVIEEEEVQAEGDDQGQGEEEEEDIVSIEDEQQEEEPTDTAPPWVRDLRHKHKEIKRQNRELQEKIKQYEVPKQQQLGVKPTLEACDYDSDQFEQKLTEWFDSKRKIEEQQAQAQASQTKQANEWNQKLNAYQEKKKSLKVKDFDDAEAYLEDTLNVTQQGIIIQGAQNPELLVYALGKNPKRAAELAAITDPVKFAFEVAKLETKLTVGKRKPATKPEKIIRGTGSASGAHDTTLNRLREQAAKTGDFTEVHEYRKQQRRKKAG